MPKAKVLVTPSEFLLKPGRQYYADLKDDPEYREVVVWPSKKYPGFWHCYRLERSGHFVDETKKPVTPHGLFLFYLDKYSTTKFEEQKSTYSDL